jgi:hypothetical protein
VPDESGPCPHIDARPMGKNLPVSLTCSPLYARIYPAVQTVIGRKGHDRKHS